MQVKGKIENLEEMQSLRKKRSVTAAPDLNSLVGKQLGIILAGSFLVRAFRGGCANHVAVESGLAARHSGGGSFGSDPVAQCTDAAARERLRTGAALCGRP